MTEDHLQYLVDSYVCPVCGSKTCDMVYESNGVCVGCDECITVYDTVEDYVFSKIVIGRISCDRED